MIMVFEQKLLCHERFDIYTKFEQVLYRMFYLQAQQYILCYF